LSILDEMLDPFEKIIWRGRPDKKAMMLWAFGGIPFALFFFAFFLLMLSTGVDLIGLPLFTLAWVIGLIVVPPVIQLRKFPNAEYMITNQRLLIKEGLRKEDVWFTRLEKIKKVIVKKGITGKILGTGKIYPITETYPYYPKHRGYSEGGMNRKVKVYNLLTEEYDEVAELELYQLIVSHPNLDVMKDPYKIQKILEEAIFGAGTNYINCAYCGYRYDLNKEGKCPHCGGTHRND
jgi:predicted Zn-ribbon and HTH transcriptional regulator